ncbi:peptide deformylase [Thiothrix winogradskyi]|uniref:Peptide deformylase n=1 Tax=Thiothrix winogradskyi TaxID=96472 RepID=A0ABY3T3H4_9GAMM|nr:peptide deformylase [Thiothrix winogradskyi]UJS25316.1 peptide deformylase [Thiothrix winogradskyi]
MAQLEILHHPDPRLRKKAAPVAQVDASIQQIVDDMFETMYANQGIGLAATQVNIHQRIITLDISETKTERLCLINPEILHKEGKIEHEEGCLSVPDYYEKVTRAERIRLRALTREGEVLEQDFDELLAICIQHEIDHLDGKLFVDYLSTLKQQRARKVVQKWEKEQAKLAERRAAAAKAIIA